MIPELDFVWDINLRKGVFVPESKLSPEFVSRGLRDQSFGGRFQVDNAEQDDQFGVVITRVRP